MNHEQEQQVKDYLKKKNLPLELLLEVEDHFMSQIHDYISEENLHFDDAFQKTKEIWHQELKLYWDGSSDLEDKCDLLRQYRKTKWKNLAKKTLQYSTSLFLMIFILFLLPTYLKGFLLTTIIVTLFLLPLAHHIYYRKEYRLLKKHQVQVTYYQVGILTYTSSVGGSIYFMYAMISKGASFFNSITSVKHLLFVALAIYVYVTILISVLICQVETIKTIQRLKAHLR